MEGAWQHGVWRDGALNELIDLEILLVWASIQII